jgi:hypothetical protein
VNAGSGMNAMGTANLVGRGSRITERVRRARDISRLPVFCADRCAEPWSATGQGKARFGARIVVALRWARLRLRELDSDQPRKFQSYVGQVGERKGLIAPVHIKRGSTSRNPVVIREPRPTNYDL